MLAGRMEVFTHFGTPTIVIRRAVVAILTVGGPRQRIITNSAPTLSLQPMIIVAMLAGRMEVFTQFGTPTIVIRRAVVAILTVGGPRQRIITNTASTPPAQDLKVTMQPGFTYRMSTDNLIMVALC